MSLPDTLRSGDVLRSAAGVLAIVARTTKRDPGYGTPLYRLRYDTPGGGSILSSRHWTLDQLAEEGCVLVEAGDPYGAGVINEPH